MYVYINACLLAQYTRQRYFIKMYFIIGKQRGHNFIGFREDHREDDDSTTELSPNRAHVSIV